MSTSGRDDSRAIIVSVQGRDVVRVVLEQYGEQHVGEATAQAGSGVAETSARATLDALDSLTPAAVEFRLDWCGVIDPGHGVAPAILVFATVSVAGVPLQQTGAALVRYDVQMASVRATLAAMNRRLKIMGA